MINFPEVLKQKKDLVWPEIEKYLNGLIDFSDFCSIPGQYRKLAEFHQQLVSDYPARKGKYLRPTWVLLVAGAMGFPENKAIRTAAAMQTSEDWILNHDDIEDDSLVRRGQPTLHRLYGKELAINAGDGLQVLMWKMLRDNEPVIGPKKTMEVIDEFYQMLTRTVLGQTVEIKWTQENKRDLEDKDILFILESKTGYYSVAGPMRLGGILAGATEEQLKTLYELGKTVGLCFQIKDDLLDLTSDFAGLKKQTGNDIYEGKRTIMLMHLFRGITGENLKKLELVMSKSREEKTDKDVRWVIEKMEEAGSLRYGQQMAEKFADKARKNFNRELGFLSRNPYRNQILAGIDFILQREH